MKITNEIFKFFLYETHLVQKSISLTEALKGKSEDEKKRINYEKTLSEFFSFRKTRDPGFKQFIMSSFSINDPSISKTIKYIQKLQCDYVCDIRNYYSFETMEEDNCEADSDKLIQEFISLSENNQFPSIIVSNKPVKINFFDYLKNQAIEEKNDTNIAVVKTLYNFLNDYNTFGKVPFIENIYHIKKSFNRKRDLEVQYLIKRDLKYSDIYLEEERMQYEEPLLRVVDFKKDIRDLFANEFNMQISETPYLSRGEYIRLNSKSKSDFAQYIKFTNDALSVAIEFWFNSKSEEEKLDLLNKEYPFRLDEPSFDNRPIFEIDTYANELCDLGYFEYALILFKKCLERSKLDADCYYFLDDIAFCYKNLQQYDHAKKYYTKACDLAYPFIGDVNWHKNRENTTRISPYSTRFIALLSKKYVAEMDYLLGNKESADKIIDEVLKEVDLLEDREKGNVLLEISLTFKKAFLPERENEVLTDAINFLDPNDHQKFSYASDRVNKLNKSINSSGLFNLKILNAILIVETSVDLIKRIELATNSFQFSKVLILNKELVALNKSVIPDFEEKRAILADSYLRVEDYRQAGKFYADFFKKCYKKGKYPSLYAGYPGICLILDGNERKGIQKIINEISSLSKKFDKSELDEILGLLLYNAVNALFESKKENVVDIIDQLLSEIEKVMPIESSSYYVVSAYLSVNWYTKAIDEIDRLLKKEDLNEDFIALIQCKKGDLYQEFEDYDNALKCYLESDKSEFYSLPGVNRAYLMERMSKAYFGKMNIAEAKKCLNIALKSTPNDPDLKKLNDEIGNFLDENLSLESIKCDPARYSMKTAEREALELYRTVAGDEEFDFSPPLGYYGKGLEIMLNEEIWQTILKEIFEKFSTEDNYGIPDELYSNLPKWLKKSLNKFEDERETLSLGTWARINPKSKDKHPVVDSVYSIINEKYGHQFATIQKACEFLRPYRNEVFHKKVKGKEETLKIRKEAISYLNPVISIIYSSDSSEEFNSQFRSEHNDIALIEEAKGLMRENREDEALELLGKAIEFNPSNTDALVFKGQIYDIQKDYDKAELCVDAALSLNENDHDAIHEKGAIYAKNGDYASALKCFEKCIKLKPDSYLGYLNAGVSLRNIIQYSKALPYLYKAKVLNKYNSEDKIKINEEIEYCEKRLIKAQETLQKIDEELKAQKNNGKLYLDKGWFLSLIENYTEALDSFKKALEFGEKENEYLWLQMFHVQAELGLYDDAKQSYEKYKSLSKSE